MEMVVYPGISAYLIQIFTHYIVVKCTYAIGLYYCLEMISIIFVSDDCDQIFRPDRGEHLLMNSAVA